MADFFGILLFTIVLSILTYFLYKEEKKTRKLVNYREELLIQYLEKKLEIDNDFWEEL